MLDLPTALLAHLQSRGPRFARLLFWIETTEISTGDPATIGFWTGTTDRSFDIGGQSRVYIGTGSLLQIPPLVGRTGVTLRNTRIVFSGASPEFRAAVRDYVIKDAPVQIHIANFDPDTRALIAEPQRRFKGVAKGLDFPRAALGQDARAELTLQSAAHVLTRSLPLRKSDEALQGRHAGDGFRRYANLSGAIGVYWGEDRGSRP